MRTDDDFGSESTKRDARDILVEVLPIARQAADDPLVGSVLNEDVIQQVLDIAWAFQFDDNRNACQKAVRDLVEVALEQRALESRQ